MANRSQKIEKNEQNFYALIQIVFTDPEPVYALGERELGVGGICAAMYDMKEDVVIENCGIHITKDAVVIDIPNVNTHIDLKKPDAWLDAITPRYWFTNTNYDC